MARPRRKLSGYARLASVIALPTVARSKERSTVSCAVVLTTDTVTLSATRVTRSPPVTNSHRKWVSGYQTNSHRVIYRGLVQIITTLPVRAWWTATPVCQFCSLNRSTNLPCMIKFSIGLQQNERGLWCARKAFLATCMLHDIHRAWMMLIHLRSLSSFMQVIGKYITVLLLISTTGVHLSSLLSLLCLYSELGFLYMIYSILYT